MEQAMPDIVLQPMVQYGFLGFAAVLLGIVIWMIRQQNFDRKELIALLRDNQSVIAENTTSNHALVEMVTDELKLTRSLHDKLLARPCIAKGEN